MLHPLEYGIYTFLPNNWIHSSDNSHPIYGINGGITGGVLIIMLLDDSSHLFVFCFLEGSCRRLAQNSMYLKFNLVREIAFQNIMLFG